MIFVDPADTPVTTPVLLLTVAFPMFDENHTIVPVAVVLKVVVRPTHTLLDPVMAGAAGKEFTVTLTACVLVQPLAFLMVMVPL